MKKRTRMAAATVFLASALFPSSGSAAPSRIAMHEAGAVANAHAAYLQLRRAADVLGGSDRLLSLQRMELELSGETHNWLQGERPGTPWPPLDYRVRAFVNWTKGRLHLAQGRERLSGRSVELDSRDFSFASRSAYSPHYVVRALMADPAQLTWREAGRERTTVSGTLHGRQVQLSLDREGLSTELTYLDNDLVDGDSQSVIRYSDYSRDGEWHLPGRVEHRRANRLLVDARIVRFEADGAEPAWLAGLPTEQRDRGPHGIKPLGTGLYLLEFPAGVPAVPGKYFGVLAEVDDGLMILEAPSSMDGSKLTRLVESISTKPITLAIPTHHHEDHALGIVDLARLGAEVRTTPGNVEFFRRAVESPRMLSGAGIASPGAQVTALSSGAEIGPVRIYDVGPSTHADEHLVFYFPEHRILFQSDMMFFRPDGSVRPGYTATCRLLSFIEAEQLPVERILSSHGGEGTMHHLRTSAAAAGGACSDEAGSG